MKYHDYRLRGYSVSNFGETVTLDLLYNYAGQPESESTICFSGVSLYHFTHTCGAIITDIEEIPVVDHIDSISDEIVTWAKQIGVTGWKDNLENYKALAVTERLRAWTIDSAIGFSGFVIAKKVT